MSRVEYYLQFWASLGVLGCIPPPPDKQGGLLSPTKLSFKKNSVLGRVAPGLEKKNLNKTMTTGLDSPQQRM